MGIAIGVDDGRPQVAKLRFAEQGHGSRFDDRGQLGIILRQLIQALRTRDSIDVVQLVGGLAAGPARLQ
jgi:hypothetical protein